MSQMTSKWARDYLLLVHSSSRGTDEDKKDYAQIIKQSAQQYMRLKPLPPEHVFATVLWGTEIKYKGLFKRLEGNSLDDLNENDKLFIFAHSSSIKVGKLEPHNLAEKLQSAGLKKVGLITFKSCSVGIGDFLEKFVNELREREILIGFAKGYLGEAETVEREPAPLLYEKITTPKGRELEGKNRYRMVGGHYANIENLSKEASERVLNFLLPRQ